MSSINKLFLALITLAVFSLVAPAAKGDVCTPVVGNLVVNCGFELAPAFTGWTQSGDTTFTSGMDPFLPHSGTYAASFGPTTLGFISQNLVTVAGNSYSLSFWLTNEFGGTNQYQVFFNGVLLTNQSNVGSFGYTLFTFNNLIATGTSTELKFGFANLPAFFDLDDIVVVQSPGQAVPEPATMLLLGGGLAGLGAKLRQRLVRHSLTETEEECAGKP